MDCVNCGCNAEVIDRGIMINRWAELGSQIVLLKERIRSLEKQSKRTPPKYLVGEWEKVLTAKELFQKAVSDLAEKVEERRGLRDKLGFANFLSLR